MQLHPYCCPDIFNPFKAVGTNHKWVIYRFRDAYVPQASRAICPCRFILETIPANYPCKLSLQTHTANLRVEAFVTL